MAGHSKWKNIKHKKAASDAKKAKIFTKLLKEITVAARNGGGDPDANPRLRTLLEKARRVNMPQDNTVRAVKKGTGDLPGAQYEQHQYEGYGPHGLAVIIDVLTDNKNRAIAELRHLFTKKGGSVAEGGAVSWMFERLGVIRGTGDNLSEESIMEALLDYDVSTIEQEHSNWYITCTPQSLEGAKHSLQNLNFALEEAEVEWVAKEENYIEPAAEAHAVAIDFLETLEDLDDVQNVYSNLA